MHCSTSALRRWRTAVLKPLSKSLQSAHTWGKVKAVIKGIVIICLRPIYKILTKHMKLTTLRKTKIKYLQHCYCEDRWKVNARVQNICGSIFARQSLRLGTTVELPNQIRAKPSFFPSRSCSTLQSTVGGPSV